MNRQARRLRLSLEWWGALLFALLPLCLTGFLDEAAGSGWPSAQMPLFVLGLCSMFASLPLFGRYKHALVAAHAARDGADEAGAWQRPAGVRRRGLLGAALPAWLAALAAFSALNPVALILLALSSVVIGCLYRIPSQLG